MLTNEMDMSTKSTVGEGCVRLLYSIFAFNNRVEEILAY